MPAVQKGFIDGGCVSFHCFMINSQYRLSYYIAIGKQ